jgi:inorganic phosphate transporter, PiT family
MEPMLILLILTILVALIFDFSNGFHDAANSISTVVATRVLSPMLAVLWAAFFNFVAAFGFGVKVAGTIGKGVVDPHSITIWVVLAALLGAIGWNVLTWLFGLPTSSSHALIGALAGAATAHAGLGVLEWEGIRKILVFVVVSPLLGMLFGLLLMGLTYRVLWHARQGPVNLWSRRLQLVSSALYSLGHGTNDAQKTMGIIAALLLSARAVLPQLQEAPAWLMPPADLHRLPWWIILSAHAAIALGTVSGGWRIVKTMGMRITDLRPIDGFCAETAGAATLFLASSLGIPVSTTHTITGAIVGVGATRRFSAVRWGVAAEIVWAWILTIPCAAMLGAVIYAVLRLIGH